MTAPAVDRPRSAYRVLERRATLITLALLLVLAGVAWWSTVVRARGMDGMTMGLAEVGIDTPMDSMDDMASSAGGPFDVTALTFLAMWTTMMVAMMLPTVGPIVMLHRMVLRRSGRGPAVTVAFVLGYLVVWTLVGLLPLAAVLGFRRVSSGADWPVYVGGAALIAAGLYQFTPWKDTCQKACQNPMTFLMTHQFGTGMRGAFRTGFVHGLYCLGCCWALMTVLFVVGLMSLPWMAAIAVIFVLEKHWRRGRLLAWTVGAAIVVLGAAVLLHPSTLATVSG